MPYYTGEKTKAVNEVLQELGYFSEDVPSNWLQRVQRALAKQQISVHSTVIYSVRRREITRRENHVNDLPIPKHPASELTLADVLAVKEFAKRFDGLDGLTNAVEVLKGLSTKE